jgi:hypothetical protein
VRVALLLVLGLTGCDRLFGLQPIDEPPRVDARSDALGDGADPARDALVQTHASCPSDFGAPYQKSQYRYLPTTLSWHAAVQSCAALDDPTSTKRVHLVVLSSDLERQHVYVNAVGSAGTTWIGFSDTKQETAFEWVSTEQVSYPDAGSNPWATAEPSTGPADDCVMMKFSTTDFDATPCTALLGFTCECDEFANDATKYN